MYSFKTLKPFLIKNKWPYLLGILWLLFVDILQLFIPEVLRSITNQLQKNHLTSNDVLMYSLYILLIGIGIGFFRFLWRMLIIGASRELEYHLRNRLFSHLLTLSTNYYNQHKTGDLMAHLTNDIHAVRMAFGPGIVAMTDAIFLNITAMVMMAVTINLRLTLLALLPMPLLIFSMTKFGKEIHTKFKSVQETFATVTDKTQENLAGVRVIKAFVQEDTEIAQFNKKSEALFDRNMELAKLFGIFHPLVQFLSSLSFIIAIWYGGGLVIEGGMLLGDFVAFITYLGLLVSSISAIGWVINVMQRGSASMERLNKILEEKPEIKDSDIKLKPDEIEASILFNQIFFKYPNTQHYALNNFSIEIPQGFKVGVIGRTGSGKTTIANLLLRLYDSNKGNIFLGGYPIEGIPLKSLREHIAFVDQDSFLFSTTIMENIGFGIDHYKIEEIQQAAAIAGIHEDIMSFPKGYETMVGEKGVTLSGGQRQRVSIARALMKKSKILILDDCLSAVDTHTEEKILTALKNEVKDKTTIIIAHRVSTLKHCDKIILLDNGVIIEEGTHEDLLSYRGLYHDFYEKQLLEEKINME
ncbi:ABC transporter ATP-binding protein [Clostridium formicaceticum]|uniref:Multidrug ABC transporter ATP-binding protein n=1 Tax=Clostridium formicaceticum TaxID=1497 RepID=A0AAC9RHG3_9CLOT|nr:ABC transporter ATP-binding protein [Clostridium formicaceticum]AOY76641.1 multidrug ABC transporter ATP-binding protein [Clostridium formicaceticum]ARE87064.1 putative multidrug resistance ABC transporter ATP-binding/permease protein YheI [Clostridium formicaceticum]